MFVMTSQVKGPVIVFSQIGNLWSTLHNSHYHEEATKQKTVIFVAPLPNIL